MTNNWVLNHQIKEFTEEEVAKLFPNRYAYEVIRLIDGFPLFLEHHYQRLLKTCGDNYPSTLPSLKTLQEEITWLTKVNKLRNVNIKIIVSKEYRAIFAITSTYPRPEDYRQGVICNLLFEERENPEIKVFQAELRKKVAKKKQETGVFESILVNKNGRITEGSKSNIFFIKGKELFTAPSFLVLSGITRQKVLEICNKQSYKVNFDAVHYSKINQFDSAFICGTSPGILPIRKIEDVHFQVDNSILKTIHKYYHTYLGNDEW